MTILRFTNSLQHWLHWVQLRWHQLEQALDDGAYYHRRRREMHQRHGIDC